MLSAVFNLRLWSASDWTLAALIVLILAIMVCKFFDS